VISLHTQDHTLKPKQQRSLNPPRRSTFSNNSTQLLMNKFSNGLQQRVQSAVKPQSSPEDLKSPPGLPVIVAPHLSNSMKYLQQSS
jgi:hypothetical protein